MRRDDRDELGQIGPFALELPPRACEQPSPDTAQYHSARLRRARSKLPARSFRGDCSGGTARPVRCGSGSRCRVGSLCAGEGGDHRVHLTHDSNNSQDLPPGGRVIGPIRALGRPFGAAVLCLLSSAAVAVSPLAAQPRGEEPWCSDCRPAPVSQRLATLALRRMTAMRCSTIPACCRSRVGRRSRCSNTDRMARPARWRPSARPDRSPSVSARSS